MIIFLIIAFGILVFLSIIGLMIILAVAFSSSSSTTSTKPKVDVVNPKVDEVNSKLEKEMNLYGLTQEEKEVVRNSNGMFEPYNFEEEDLEEDDYYYDED